MTLCSSQNTYPRPLTDSTVVITNQQLKQTNLIFLEHNKLKLEVAELNNRIRLTDSLVGMQMKINQVQKLQIDNLQKYSEEANQTIIDQNKQLRSVKRTKNAVLIGGSAISIVLLVLAIL